MTLDLDQLEAEAKNDIFIGQGIYGRIEYRDERSERILALISELRSMGRLASAEDALRFYADRESWKSPYDDTGRGPEIYEDEGQEARAHFEKWASPKEEKE